jgi:hypothetical protein
MSAGAGAAVRVLGSAPATGVPGVQGGGAPAHRIGRAIGVEHVGVVGEVEVLGHQLQAQPAGEPTSAVPEAGGIGGLRGSRPFCSGSLGHTVPRDDLGPQLSGWRFA